MTDKKKHDDRDRQKISDEDLEDVAGGATAIEYGLIASLKTNKKKPDTPAPDSHHHKDS